MALEIEAKMNLADPAVMADRLRDRGATLLGRVLEVNTFFDTRSRALVASDSGLRVRAVRDLESGAEQVIVTHKGPNLPGELKRREETEVTVDDAAAMGRLLERIGYERTLIFQKRRQSWKLGGCKVELDELPELGHFIEIEGPDEAAVMKVRQELGLAAEPLIRRGYATMLGELAKIRGQNSVFEFARPI